MRYYRNLLLFVIFWVVLHNVMEGFINRIWGKIGVDKAALAGMGVYLVRFTRLLRKSYMRVPNLLDSKPVILKEWHEDMNLVKDHVQLVPIWVKLQGLDVKYWG